MPVIMSKAERVLGAFGPSSTSVKTKRRPPALQYRSLSSDPPHRSQSSHGHKHSTSTSSPSGAISVSSTIYPFSSPGRDSFIDLDDASPLHRDLESPSSYSVVSASHSQKSNPNAMYPTPTRPAFRPLSRADTVLSTTSQLPKFNSPAEGAVPYQALTPTPRRRPMSMVVSPTAAVDADDPFDSLHFDYTDDMERGGRKPPIPITPKPTLLLRKAVAASSPPSPKQHYNVQSYHHHHQQQPASQYHHNQQQPLPPTTNTRNASERQELLRKHRKLAQVFGEGVSGVLGSNDDLQPYVGRSRVRGPVPPSSHRRGSLSAGAREDLRGQVLVLPPLRRHSTPSSAEFGEIAVTKVVPAPERQGSGGDRSKSGRAGEAETGSGNLNVRTGRGRSKSPESPESFMELSDHDDQGGSTQHRGLGRQTRGGDDVSVLSTGTLDPDPDHDHSHDHGDPKVVKVEVERKKMRDKLAKLHRFLGSRVPVELALGAEWVLKDLDLPEPAAAPAPAPAPTRPPPAVTSSSGVGSLAPPVGSDMINVNVKDGGKKWKRRRRSSSSGALPGYVSVNAHSAHLSSSDPQLQSQRWDLCAAAASEASERMKDELGEKERALNLKRANKMEQMFGTRPPPTLYQPHLANANTNTSAGRQSQSSSRSKAAGQLRITAQGPVPVMYVNSNPNISAYRGKSSNSVHRGTSRTKHKRPGTSESRDALLEDDGDGDTAEGGGGDLSQVYMFYRHSLNSLTDIVDKDDMESLAELHQYINGPDSSDDDDDTKPPADSLGRSPSYSSSVRSRRRSLPARTNSLLSIASTITIPPPAPDPSGFQQRRRRAAKLANFFGVNYRELFRDVLDSIEIGMREEVSIGNLQAEDFEELLGKLRKLKIRRDEITV